MNETDKKYYTPQNVPKNYPVYNDPYHGYQSLLTGNIYCLHEIWIFSLHSVFIHRAMSLCRMFKSYQGRQTTIVI